MIMQPKHIRAIRIGTRQSALALWQANHVKDALEFHGHICELVPIKSAGDIEKIKPLYAFGMSGVFTKALDTALLNDKIDVAVHSLKDVPTELPQNIAQVAVLKRGLVQDVFIPKPGESLPTGDNAVIATGSLRRTAQWLSHYPKHKIMGLRGNVPARLKKLANSDWDGIILAAAGLDRLGLLRPEHSSLDWMVPAPGQGAIMIAARSGDEFIRRASAPLRDKDSEVCTGVERKFLNLLEAGCTAPIGAYARIQDGHVHFKGILLSCDGQEKIEVSRVVPRLDAHLIAQDCVAEIESKGGRALVEAAAKFIATEQTVHIISTKKLLPTQKNMFSDDFEITDYDFLRVQYKGVAQDFLRRETVVFTSQNAVLALGEKFAKQDFRFSKIFCVGEKTQALIEREIGPVTHRAQNAQQLATYISAQTNIKSLTYFCGNLRLDELPDTLKRHYIKVEEVPCYETTYTPHKISSPPDAVLFFSPSGVESFVQKNDVNTTAFCIGPTTARVAQQYFRWVIQAQNASMESIIKRVNKHYV